MSSATSGGARRGAPDKVSELLDVRGEEQRAGGAVGVADCERDRVQWRATRARHLAPGRRDRRTVPPHVNKLSRAKAQSFKSCSNCRLSLGSNRRDRACALLGEHSCERRLDLACSHARSRRLEE